MGEEHTGQDITLERPTVWYNMKSLCVMLLWDERGREEEGLEKILMQKQQGVSIRAAWRGKLL